MIVSIRQELGCEATSEADLPDIQSWDQVKKWYVKWDTLHYTLDGQNWKSEELMTDSDPSDCIRWKRPLHVWVEDEGYGVLDELEN